MADWTEADSALYREISDIAVPYRDEMMRIVVTAVPFERDAAIRIIDLGAGEGRLSAQLLDAFPRATLVALDGSASMREIATPALARFADRARVAAFDVAALDWWDVMFGADVIVSSLCLHHLNDAKKQYFYKAAADRMNGGGALLIADLVAPTAGSVKALFADEWDAAARLEADARGRADLFERFVEARWNHFRFPDPGDRPSALFHQLVWLRHAGFDAVECLWMRAGHAVFGGFKQAAASGSRPPAGS